MREHWEGSYHRGQQSIGVWGAFDLLFVFGEVTLASHTADVGGLQTRANQRDVQQDAVDIVRLDRDNNVNFMQDLCIRFPRKLEGDLAPNHPWHAEISDLRTIKPDSVDATAARTRRTISLWTRINGARAAQVPPVAAFKVGDALVADLQAALDQLGTLLQNVETERSKLTQKREALRELDTRVDENNKRWFAAWEGEFAVDSPQRNALSQIDTGPQMPVPQVLGIATAVFHAPEQVALTYAPNGGKHATSFKLVWQIEGVDAEFVHETVLNLAGQTVTVANAAGKTVNFKARGLNSTGSTDSAVKAVAFP